MSGASTDTTPRPRSPASWEELASLAWAGAHRAGIQMRYGDIDAMGHLNNAVYVQYLETSRVLLMRDLGVPDREDRSVIARLELDYRQEVRWGQEVTVESLVERVGASSWTVVSRLLADGQPCAYARTVQVRVGDGLRPEPLPEALRERLGSLLAR
ncbi:thioesterase family protein [Deinococcus sp. MIMF12]|uniref:Thioesterase family protein n=1 Tax=Deinococcus rhizophilus TaxID=3049544 RepID=A0ABT7JF67_9DEIO|nr:thioesterase family protein [Deinococcus rhizophilus]MDL2343145.1 thioesterase family protein [Deinococcus rhizophilus]